MIPFQGRTIREEPQAEAVLDDLFKRFPRFEQVWEGWSWRLAKDPALDATQIPGLHPPVFMVRTPDFSQYKIPVEVTIFYEWDDDEVKILGMRVLE